MACLADRLIIAPTVAHKDFRLVPAFGVVSVCKWVGRLASPVVPLATDGVLNGKQDQFDVQPNPHAHNVFEIVAKFAI